MHFIDPDLWARLSQGDYVLQNGHVMHNDFFSYVQTHHEVDHEWGSGVIFSTLLDNFGYNGLVLLKTVLVFLMFFFMCSAIKARGIKSTKPYNILFFVLVLCSFETIIQTGLRCQNFSFMFYALFICILENVRNRGRNNLLYLLPLLMIFWTNLHGGSIAGTGLILMYALGEALNRKHYAKYLLTFVLCAFAMLINPYGMEYITFIIPSVTMPRGQIAEWVNIFNTPHILINAKVFSIIAGLTVFAGILKNLKNKEKIDYTKLIVVAGSAYVGLSHIKQLPFWIIAATIFLYDDFFAIFNAFMQKIRNILRIKSGKFISVFVALKESIVYLLVILISCFYLYFNFPGEISHQALTYYPVKAAEFMRLNKLQGRLLNNFNIGCYLSYKLYPQNLIHTDGRYESVYYTETSRDNIDFFANAIIPGINPAEIDYSKYLPAKAVFVKDGFPEYIIANKNDNVFFALYKSGNYSEIYRDSDFAIFARNDVLKDKYVMPSEDEKYYAASYFDKFEKKRGK